MSDLMDNFDEYPDHLKQQIRGNIKQRKSLDEIIKDSKILKLMKESVEQQIGEKINIQVDKNLDAPAATATDKHGNRFVVYKPQKKHESIIGQFEGILGDYKYTNMVRDASTLQMFSHELGHHIAHTKNPEARNKPFLQRELEANALGAQLLQRQRHISPSVVNEAIRIQLEMSTTMIDNYGHINNPAVNSLGNVIGEAQTNIPLSQVADVMTQSKPGTIASILLPDHPNYKRSPKPRNIDTPQITNTSRMVELLNIEQTNIEARDRTIVDKFKNRVDNFTDYKDTVGEYRTTLYDKSKTPWQKFEALRKNQDNFTAMSKPESSEHFEIKNDRMAQARVEVTEYQKYIDRSQKEHLQALLQVNRQVMELADTAASRETANRSSKVIEGSIKFGKMYRTAQTKLTELMQDENRIVQKAQQVIRDTYIQNLHEDSITEAESNRPTREQVADLKKFGLSYDPDLSLDEIQERYNKASKLIDIGTEEWKQMDHFKSNELLGTFLSQKDQRNYIKDMKLMHSEVMQSFSIATEVAGHQDTTFRNLLVQSMDQHGLLGPEGVFSEKDLFQGRIYNILNDHMHEAKSPVVEEKLTVRRTATTDAKYNKQIVESIDTGIPDHAMFDPETFKDRQASLEEYMDEMRKGAFKESTESESKPKKKKHIQEKANNQVLGLDRKVILYGDDNQPIANHKDVRDISHRIKLRSTPKEQKDTGPSKTRLMDGARVEEASNLIVSEKLNNLKEAITKESEITTALTYDVIKERDLVNLKTSNYKYSERVQPVADRLKQLDPSRTAMMAMSIDYSYYKDNVDASKQALANIGNKLYQKGYNTSFSEQDLFSKQGGMLYAWWDPKTNASRKRTKNSINTNPNAKSYTGDQQILKGKYGKYNLNTVDQTGRYEVDQEIKTILLSEEHKMRKSIIRESNRHGIITQLATKVAKFDGRTKSANIKGLGAAVLAAVGFSQIGASAISGESTTISGLEQSLFFDGESHENYTQTLKQSDYSAMINTSGIDIAEHMNHQKTVHIGMNNPAGRYDRARGVEAISQYHNDFSQQLRSQLPIS